MPSWIVSPTMAARPGWREYRGLTATALARHAKVSGTRLSAMENGAATGSVPARTLREIAVALGVTVGDLLPSAGQGSAP